MAEGLIDTREVANNIADLSGIIKNKAYRGSVRGNISNITTNNLVIGTHGNIVEALNLVSQSAHGRMSKEDKKKLDSIESGSNKYVHPDTHPASMITEDAAKRFVSQAMVDGWNTDIANRYTKAEIDNMISGLLQNIDWKESVDTFADLATTYPNPQDGWTVNVKDTDITYRWSGTAWIAISLNALPMATPTVDGKMSKEDKAKLDGIAVNANNYVHPTTHLATMITEDATHRFVSDTEKSTWNNKANASHGNHVPTTETANNTRFLRNDNTWQAVTPGNIGAMPIGGGTFTGKIATINDQYFSNSSYGLNMNNSDIIGLNALVFKDLCDTSGEGIFFPKTSSVAGNSPNINDYDRLWSGGSVLKYNSDVILTDKNFESFNIAKRYRKDITVGGDANTYYPVAIPLNLECPRRIICYRGYAETAPSTWNTPTHKGGLIIDMNVYLAGWGGMQYWIDGSISQTYSKIVSNIISLGPATDMLVLLLRGGGAVYHFESDQNISPTVYLSRFDNSRVSGSTTYTGYVDPTTSVGSSFNATDLRFSFTSRVEKLLSWSSLGNSSYTVAYMNGYSNSGNFSVSGNITGSKVYNAVWNDYAELFPKLKSTITEAGDIISLDISNDKEVYTKATEETSSFIVGVHSDEYAHLIGGERPLDDYSGTFEEFNKDKFIPVGLAGRVKAKCIGIIKKGDKLVISDIPGVARAFNPKLDNINNVFGMAVENKNNPDVITRVRMFIKN